MYVNFEIRRVTSAEPTLQLLESVLYPLRPRDREAVRVSCEVLRR
jgi:hypothetical protein